MNDKTDEQDDHGQWRVLGWRCYLGKLQLVVFDAGSSEDLDVDDDYRFGWNVSGVGVRLSGHKSTKQAAIDAAEDAAADLAPKDET